MKYPAALASAVLFALASSATAATVTAGFNTDDGRFSDFATETYRENGLNFKVLSGHYDIFGMAGPLAFNVDNGSGEPAIIEITYDGGTFDLLSFDVTNTPGIDEAVFTSDVGDSFTVSNGLGLNLFPTSFNGVSIITLAYDGISFEFDDFTIDDRIGIDSGTPSPVPLPATLPLLALALAGLGFGARRRSLM